MGADTAIYVHKAPVFLCAPANIENSSQQVKDTFKDGSNAIVPWPYWTKLRFKVLTGQSYDPVVLQIIQAKTSEWMALLNPPLSVEWVAHNADAEIRISFRSDIPSWSCMGPRALKYDQTQPTMNFNFGGWASDRKVVYPPRQIGRIASHLVGHALGLPHAESKWIAKWDEAKVKAQLGETAQKLISQDRGGFANPAGSIMHFDLPAALSSTPTVDDRQGALGIDKAAKEQLQRVYIRPRDVAYTQIEADQVGIRWIGSIKKHAQRVVETSKTTKGILALNKIDFGLSANWRIRSQFDNVRGGAGYTVTVDSWDDTVIDSASCDALTFDDADKRVQSGFVSYLEDSKNPNGEWGKMRTRTVQFPTAYDKTPEVVVFIYGFDVGRVKNLRVKALVTRTDKNGFDVEMGSWADTLLYDVRVFWLAHHADDATFRSGTVATNDGSKPEKVMSVTFKSPMLSRPRVIFRGLNFIDLGNDQNPRASFEVPTWNEAGFQARFATWGGNNRFFDLAGSYLAIL